MIDLAAVPLHPGAIARFFSPRKNGEKKNRRGKNPVEKKGLKKSCREEKETGDLGPKSSPLVAKRVAERAAPETPT